jgi:hypothetical protein
MVRVLAWLLVLALTVYTVVDCVQTDERRIRTLPKALWVLLILVLPLVGPIAWLIAAGRPATAWARSPRRSPAWPRRRPRLPP